MAHFISVTKHAVNRWMQRVDTRADYQAAEAAIRSHARAVCAAADFGCKVVKLATGDRLVIDGRSVVTVLARHQGPNGGWSETMA